MIDARRGEVFCAGQRDGSEVWPQLVATPSQVADQVKIDGAPLAAGDGALRFAAQLEATSVAVAPPEARFHQLATRHSNTFLFVFVFVLFCI